ncbi:hypothetical protein ACLI1A_16265 [Flavobacterium sp. RHBU_3]|uniref:hypothetical protein n=1 Tax=Flavobacterium sp. RHBU_3 TaxID=3391184 RepID=UPI003985581B
MKKTTLLTVSLVILILLNLLLLGSIFLGPKQGPPLGEGPGMQRPREIIINELQFDNKQIKRYDILIQEHRSKINELDKSIRDNKEKLYGLLAKDFTQNEKDSLIAVINNYQREIEISHFKHFLEIKKICKPNQLETFKSLVVEFPKLFGPKPPRGPRP